MAKINANAKEQSHGSPLAENVEASLANIAITTSPVVICGVNRKVNIGNWENIDIYCGIALPINDGSTENMEELKASIEQAAAYGFTLTSTETYDRYKLIKDAQRSNQNAPESPPA
jgi:hypothetical protein